MKKILLFFFLNLFLANSFAATSNDSIKVFYAENPIHNLMKDSLRILDIGNSYTEDATYYIPNIAAAVGAKTGYSLYRAVRGGASYKNWVDVYNDSDTGDYWLVRSYGNTISEVETGKALVGDGSLFRTALQNGMWDIILIHQVSLYANDFDPWGGNGTAGYLKELISIIRETNPQATIGFLLVHSYRSDYVSNTEKSSLKRWENIAIATKNLKLNYGIDLVIPYGTAVQNLRATYLNDNYEFSTDGTHLASGLGDYVAACCYWEALFATRFGSVLGNSFRSVKLDESIKGVKNITDETALVAQKAAILATKNMYQVTNIDSFDIYNSLPAEYIYFENNLIGYNYNEPIDDIIVPEGIVGVIRGAFKECKDVKKLYLPRSLKTLGNYAFHNCINLDTVISLIPDTELFAIDTTVFNNIDKDGCCLYVPYGAKDKYQQTMGWRSFESIVELPVDTLILNKREAILVKGTSMSLVTAVLPFDATDSTVVWTTSNDSVAIVENGLVTALSSGIATITATVGECTASCELTVIVPVTEITLSSETVTLVVGDTLSLVATVLPYDATDNTVVWTTSNDSVATVDNGLVTTHSSGSATITATAGEYFASCDLTVMIPVTEIILAPETATLAVGDTLSLVATVLPYDATDSTVVWTTSNDSVAIVENGLVTALSSGTATITATAGECSANCEIMVVELESNIDLIELSSDKKVCYNLHGREIIGIQNGSKGVVIINRKKHLAK